MLELSPAGAALWQILDQSAASVAAVEPKLALMKRTLWAAMTCFSDAATAPK